MYVRRFTEILRNGAGFISADRTSGLRVAPMRQVLPGLSGCALGPVHLAIAVAQEEYDILRDPLYNAQVRNDIIWEGG